MSVYEGHGVTLHHGDCLDVLRSLPDCSVDSVVCDPPYGLEFMGKEWDGADGFRRSLNPNDAGRDNAFVRTSRTSPEYRTTSKATAGMAGTGYTDGAERLERPSHFGGLNPRCRTCDRWQRGGNPCRCEAPDFPNERLPRLHTFQRWCEAWATECLRVLKPGGHLLAFGGTRTWHRLACAVEDAGFEVRDSIAWLYGSGFPKSLDVSKAIDRRRHDADDKVTVTTWLADVADSNGVTRADVDAHMGTSDMGGWWLSRLRHRCAIPTLDQVPALLDVLGIQPDDVPDEIRALLIDLNGMKGQPGPAWFAREVVGSASVPIGHAFAGSTYGGDSSGRIVDLTAPATPDAERWQGWGTALKPAFEPVVVARKPLVSPAVNVLETVESELRKTLGLKEIRWTSAPASDAARRGQPASSSSTEAPRVAATSAVPADVSETPSVGRPTGSGSAPKTERGAKPTGSTSAHTAASRTASSATRSSMPTVAPAPAVVSGSTSSSPSTTSTGAGPLTDEPCTARSTRNSAAKDSQTAIGSSVGIATGLTGSRAHVLIERLPDGSFVWPEGLPRAIPGGSFTVAANVLAWGTGALNVDGCRVEHANADDLATSQAKNPGRSDTVTSGVYGAGRPQQSVNTAGRWPANVVLDDSQARLLDAESGERGGGVGQSTRGGGGGGDWNPTDRTEKPGQTVRGDGREIGYGDTGGASRFFPTFRYEAKAPASERPKVNGTAHPTVKPLDLMRWLVRLVTPPGGTVLEPFAGSGTTVEACIVEGFQCIAIEREADYLPLITQRIHRRCDPVAAIKQRGDDLGLFELDEEPA